MITKDISRKSFIRYSFTGLAGVSLFPVAILSCSSTVKKYHIVIYGGTSAGIAAAIQASRSGKSVALIEPSLRIGGLTTGGLGQTDGGGRPIGGISREFYRNIKRYYEDPSHWKWQPRNEYVDVPPPERINWTGFLRTHMASDKKDMMLNFEPSAALTVYHEMMASENIDLFYRERLNRINGVVMNRSGISRIVMESGSIFEGNVFIDATYEGDLMAAAGVTYTVGRESNTQYGETLNGVQANPRGMSLSEISTRNAEGHNLQRGVDPYRIPGNPESGLLPGISDEPIRPEGSGDDKVQAYCFRMTLTDHPDNRIPFQKPSGYSELDYELLFRNYEAGEVRVPLINASMPNRKTDANNRNGVSINWIGQNYAWPEASFDEREQIMAGHRAYQQGIMWTLANHPRIPDRIRQEVSKWGTCKDEYESEDGWQDQLYIREARRMVGDLVMTQHHCEGFEKVNDSVGLASHGIDSHHVQRYVTDKDDVQNEGNVMGGHLPGRPYPVGYGSILPRKQEVDNLLVPAAISATHVAFGSIRMEPVFMILGQSASVAASLAIDHKMSVQDLPYSSLKARLLEYGQVLNTT